MTILFMYLIGESIVAIWIFAEAGPEAALGAYSTCNEYAPGGVDNLHSCNRSFAASFRNVVLFLHRQPEV
jgi:hypothetical protein